MYGVLYLLKEYFDELNVQVQCNVICLQIWIDCGQFVLVDLYYLFFVIWVVIQIYVDFDWQIFIVIGKEQFSDVDYDVVVEIIICLVLKGCMFDG